MLLVVRALLDLPWFDAAVAGIVLLAAAVLGGLLLSVIRHVRRRIIRFLEADL